MGQTWKQNIVIYFLFDAVIKYPLILHKYKIEMNILRSMYKKVFSGDPNECQIILLFNGSGGIALFYARFMHLLF